MISLDSLTLAQWYASISSALRAHDVSAGAGLIALMSAHGYSREADELRRILLLLLEVER